MVPPPQLLRCQGWYHLSALIRAAAAAGGGTPLHMRPGAGVIPTLGNIENCCCGDRCMLSYASICSSICQHVPEHMFAYSWETLSSGGRSFSIVRLPWAVFEGVGMSSFFCFLNLFFGYCQNGLYVDSMWTLRDPLGRKDLMLNYASHNFDNYGCPNRYKNKVKRVVGACGCSAVGLGL